MHRTAISFMTRSMFTRCICNCDPIFINESSAFMDVILSNSLSWAHSLPDFMSHRYRDLRTETQFWVDLDLKPGLYMKPFAIVIPRRTICYSVHFGDGVNLSECLSFFRCWSPISPAMRIPKCFPVFYFDKFGTL